jgi:peptidoglycan L-alanyl-D-glutamate endopeptidase CwlK
MSTNLDDLIPEFRVKVVDGLAALAAQGFVFKPYFTLRDPVAQARLWRQSRSSAVVQAQIDSLKAAGCDFIVACFARAGTSSGPQVTNALPGLSWHQYGEAVDCYLVGTDGQPVWESPSYATYGAAGDAHGMWWGGHFNDNDHWQNRTIEPGAAFGSIKQINDRLAKLWPDLIPPAAAPTPAPAPISAAVAPASLPFAATAAVGYRPSASLLPLLGSFAGLIPSANPSTQAFVHPPRFLGQVQTPSGQVVVIDSALELDTDGWIGDRNNVNWQSGTSLRYAGGPLALDANAVPYFVLPLPITWPRAFGIGLGDYAAVLFNGRLTYAVFGDFGPHTKIGEGSVQLFRQLGQERLHADGSIINAGTDPGVLTIVFPGSANTADQADEATLTAAIAGRGADLFGKLKI